MCVSVCVCKLRSCVQVRSFNFDLCFRLFCVAFVDFCHLNRNFYFLHVAGHGLAGRSGLAWTTLAQPSPVFIPAAAAGFFFSSQFFMNACPRGIANARAWQIGFLFSDIWNWRTLRSGINRQWQAVSRPNTSTNTHTHRYIYMYIYPCMCALTVDASISRAHS